jgi:response regulator RpfG family c-di-GMP phosphodiesterase
MSRKITFSIIFLVTIVCSFVFAEDQSAKEKQAKITVLIVKDSSYLEMSVSRILQDSLTRRGYSVNEVNIADIGSKKASSYTISIIFSAISPGNEVAPSIQNYISTKKDSEAKILLYTVYGNVYTKKAEPAAKVDATTQASEKLHPELIATQILRSLKP